MTGLEPATSGVTGRRSNQLSYIRMWAVWAREGRLIGPDRNRVNGRVRLVALHPVNNPCPRPPPTGGDQSVVSSVSASGPFFFMDSMAFFAEAFEE